MKKVIFLLTVLFTLGAFHKAEASHVAGAEISYRYIGDSTGTANEYEITVIVYRDSQGIPWTLDPFPLSIQSGVCNATLTANLTMEYISVDNDTVPGPGGPVPGYDNCANEGDTEFDRFHMFRYKGVAILPPCPDWVMSYTLPAARNSAIDNLASLNTLLLVAKLNNTLGPNSSASFTTPAVKSFCKDRDFEWSQGAAETDPGDNLYFSLAEPLEGAYPGNGTGYNAGYSVSDPMTTINGFNLDPATGIIKFRPAKKEFIVFKIVVQDFRIDPVSGQEIQVGEVMREIQLPIFEDCKGVDDFFTGPRLDFSKLGQSELVVDKTTQQYLDILALANLNTDGNPPGNYAGPGNPDFTSITIPVITSYSCFDSIVTLNFDEEFLPTCGSIDPTDFRIIGPDGILRPVIDINRNCNFFPGQTATSVINLILEKPFDVNGRYIMFTKTGNDGDVIANECGFELAPYFIFLIDVSDCPPLIYSVENVTVQEDKQIKVDWTVNPEYFAKGADKVFSAWAILKRPANAGAFYPQDYIKAPTARSWVDNFVTKEEVDATQFEYSIQLIQNGVALAPQNNVNSILLKSETVNENELAFTWNEYYGWGNPQYQFYWGAYDSTLSDFDWQPLGPLDNSKSLTFLIDDNIGATEELLYGFKVEAESPDPSVTFISESNWLTLDYRPKVPDPEDTILGTPYIPNVFTPNNDGFHDTFWISLEEKDGNFRQYPEVSVEVYNRWGLLVYQNSNFGEINTQAEGWDGTDMNSGQQLADGVYYYVINMKDPETFTEKNFKGHLTIFKNGQ